MAKRDFQQAKINFTRDGIHPLEKKAYQKLLIALGSP